MYRRQCLIILITALLFISINNGLGQAASKDQIIAHSAYIPLVVKDSTFMPSQIGIIGVDSNNYANTYIYKVNEDGSGLQNLTVEPTPYLSFSWSPDGSKIAFNSYWAGNDEIYVMNADGSTITRLTFEPGYDEFPAWSPDGAHLAFSSNRQGSRQVYVMGADGSTVIRLTNLALGCGNHIWSPDGTIIAFDNFNSAFNDEEIYLVKPDGTGLKRLTNNGFFDSVKAWSPDSSKILFLSNRDWSGAVDRADVYVMNKDGTNPVRLTISGNIQDASWSPDGSKIAYSDYSAPNGLFIMDPDGTKVTEIQCQSNHIATFDSAWSPDGTEITYAPSSGAGLYTVRIDGSSCLQLTSMLANNPRWRPGK
jgi:TolB protein